MRGFFFGLLIIIAIVIAGLLIAPFFIPVSTYKEPILEAARESTGRDISIDGDIGLALFPRIEVTLNDVTVGNAKGGQADYLAKVAELGVGVELVPLLSGTINVDRFELISPDIYLEEDAGGQSNWTFEGDDTTAQVDVQRTDSGQRNVDLNNISLNNVRLVDGRVAYLSADGTSQTYENINVTLSLTSLDDPFAMTGSMVMNGEQIQIDADVAKPRALVDGGETAAELKVTSDVVDASFDGTATSDASGDMTLEGKVALDIPSLRDLSAAAGSPIEGSGGFGALKLSGGLKAEPKAIVFRNAEIDFDGMKGTGRLVLATGGSVPKISGDLTLDVLDTNTFTADTGGNETGGGGNNAAPASDRSWSDDPINFAALKSFNADLTLAANKLIVGDIKLENTKLDLDVKAGVLTAKLSEMDLYGGTGVGGLTLDARRQNADIQSSFTLTSLQALPFLTDAAKFDRVEGTGDFAYTIRTQGNTQKALVSNLSGDSNIKVVDGAWRGVNLAAMARTLQGVFGSGKQSEDAGQENVGSGQKTDFAELSGSFNIANGQVRNEDLQLLNPFVRVTGAGVVDLPAQTVDYRLVPKVVGAIEGQGGTFDATGVTVPIVVRGSMYEPRYGPDFGGLLKGTLTNALTGEDSGDALQNLLGQTIGNTLGGSKDEAPADGEANGEEGQDDPDGAAAEAAEEQTAPEPAELLRGLIGGKKQDEN